VITLHFAFFIHIQGGECPKGGNQPVSPMTQLAVTSGETLQHGANDEMTP